MEDWKPEYDARLSKWQAEAAEAREKAEATRVRIEKERETEQLSVKQRAENEKKVLSEVEEKRRREERLKRELGEEDVIRSSSSRGDKVREAWELVKGHEVVTDGRGVTGGDTTRQKEPLKAVSPGICHALTNHQANVRPYNFHGSSTALSPR